MTRHHYGALMHLPAWGLYNADGELVATIRAERAEVARDLFKAHGYEAPGGRVKRVPAFRIPGSWVD